MYQIQRRKWSEGMREESDNNNHGNLIFSFGPIISWPFNDKILYENLLYVRVGEIKKPCFVMRLVGLKVKTILSSCVYH